VLVTSALNTDYCVVMIMKPKMDIS